MAYSSEIATILTDQLKKFVTLNPHELAGHVANLDFWVAEVRHCLDVIDGYNPRFEQLKAAQARHISEHGTLEFRIDEPSLLSAPSPPRRVADRELQDARRLLCDATYRFLVRCFKAGLIDEAVVRRTCGRLDIGVEARDLRQRT
jgi:hypothetical protein